MGERIERKAPAMTGKTPSLPRAAALIGPLASGKTTLLDALLARSGVLARAGRVADGTTVGDASPEARARRMSVEGTVAATRYLDETWTIIDTPGSVEFRQTALDALRIVDVAVVVVEPDPARAVMVAPFLKYLDAQAIPHLVFINKIDQADVRLRETLEALQAVSDRPLVLREVPIREDKAVIGFVDLASERAWRYRAGQPSEMVVIPEELIDEERRARQGMLEHLADFDDHLLEEILEDVTPPADEIYDDLTRDLAGDLIVPVFFGSAESGAGITRLLKALRHEAPGPAETASRLGLDVNGTPAALVFKVQHAQHTGRLAFARIFAGDFTEGQDLNGGRLSGLLTPGAGGPVKTAKAGVGEVAAFAKVEGAGTGQWIGANGGGTAGAPLEPLFGMALGVERTGDDVKLTAALAKLIEEDPSYRLEHVADPGEMVLWGQGEIHLLVALERLKSRFGLAVTTAEPSVPHLETITKAVSAHGRHKKQSGGHGQFGDVTLEIAPLGRGEGFTFVDRIVGGAIPKQYIWAVEEGVRDFLARGPLGFPVVDVTVSLTDGGFHSVDSSDMAFKTAARLAMSEAFAEGGPILLEPILKVTLSVPADATPKAQRIVSGRRGQILGFDAKPGWPGWDEVSAYLPQAEMSDLIIELRSATMGVGHFAQVFDHLQEIGGRAADAVIEARKARLKG